MKGQKVNCDYPGCVWQGKNKKEHVRICHPDADAVQSVSAKEIVPSVVLQPQVQEPTTPALPPVAEKTPHHFDAKKTAFIVLGIALIAVGIYFGAQWYKNYNRYELGIFTALLIGSGAVSTYLGLHSNAKAADRPSLRAGGKKFKGAANCLNIYARVGADNKPLPYKVEFDQMADAPGMRRLLKNDHRYYATNVIIDKPRDLVLPDTQFCDPHQLKDAAEMKYSREYYTPEPSMLQKLKPAIFAVIIIIGGLILILVGGNAPPA